jgi:Sec7-like guanine-nucleotide exchange factor
MNNLHYYTILVQNTINARNKVNDFGTYLKTDISEKDGKSLRLTFNSLIEGVFNSFEAICELYFSLDENDQTLKNRIINLHKAEIGKLSELGEVKEDYCFIHKFLELK